MSWSDKLFGRIMLVVIMDIVFFAVSFYLLKRKERKNTAEVPAPAVQEVTQFSNMQPCPSCGELIAKNAVTCPKCGNQLAQKLITCKYCGGTLSQSATQCPHCAAPNSPTLNK